MVQKAVKWEITNERRKRGTLTTIFVINRVERKEAITDSMSINYAKFLDWASARSLYENSTLRTAVKEVRVTIEMALTK